MSQPDALVFDLDGTLWSALPSCVMAWNRALQRMGITSFTVTEALAAQFTGKLLNTIFTEYFTFLPPAQHAQLSAIYAEEESVCMKAYGGQLYPNAEQVLTRLAVTCKLYIVSNCQRGYIENFLQQHTLAHLFTDYECSGNTGLPKAANLASIIARNHLQHAVYIGDTQGDFDAALANNIPFVYAAYGFGKVHSGNFYQVNSLEELGGLVFG
jgi:phosphoglycolate phosphatase